MSGQQAAGTSQTQDDEVQQNWGKKVGQKFKNKSASEFFDPCQEFADRSIKCMRRNGGDRDMCTDYFQAYRDCKKAWLAQMKDSTGK